MIAISNSRKGIPIITESEGFQENVKKEKINLQYIFIIIIIIVIIIIAKFLPKGYFSKNEPEPEPTGNTIINLPFSFNIDNKGNISKPNEIFSFIKKDYSANRPTEENYSLLVNFTNLNELNASKWIDLTDEIKEKLKGKGNLNNKKYILALFIYRKTEMNIFNRKDLKLMKNIKNN